LFRHWIHGWTNDPCFARDVSANAMLGPQPVFVNGNRRQGGGGKPNIESRVRSSVFNRQDAEDAKVSDSFISFSELGALGASAVQFFALFVRFGGQNRGCHYCLTDDIEGVQSAGMGTAAAETVKEFVRIAANAGLAKEVIALLEKKAALLTEQVAALESEYANLKAENANLKAQLKLLPREGEELSRDTIKILKLFFDRASDISTEEILK
jgi:hypothetical protein